MVENLLNICYLLGFIIAWIGLSRQIFYMYKRKDARSFKLTYGICLVIAKFMSIPRVVLSCYWVWWLQEAITTTLTILWFIAILKYGQGKERENDSK